MPTQRLLAISMAAMMAADAVLKAAMDIETALADAKAALMAAEGAKMKVMELAADHPARETLMTTVDRVVKMAEMYVAAVMAIHDGIKLEDAVAAVEGDDEKGTPRSKANVVGEAIAAALASTNAAGHPHGAAVAAGTAAELQLVMDNAKGMTWAEIVGEDNLMTKPIGASPARAGVKVASIAGMAVEKVWGTAGDRPAGDVADGTLQGSDGSANYMGIAGTAYLPWNGLHGDGRQASGQLVLRPDCCKCRHTLYSQSRTGSRAGPRPMWQKASMHPTGIGWQLRPTAQQR